MMWAIFGIGMYLSGVFLGLGLGKFFYAPRYEILEHSTES